MHGGHSVVRSQPIGWGEEVAMKGLNRRQFMRWLGIQLAALGMADFLAACQGRIVEMPPTALTPGSDSGPEKATNTVKLLDEKNV